MPSADEILVDIVKKSGNLGVAVRVSSNPTILCNSQPVSGFFDEELLTINVAIGRPVQKWMGTLLHEYCHATQWAEQCTIWKQCEKLEQKGTIDQWLTGTNMRHAAELIKVTQELEADNERRTVRLIKELGAPVDITEYCKQANAYLHFHNIMIEERKWFGAGKGPYDMPSVWPLFNGTIDSTFKTTAKQRVALLSCV